MALHAPHAHANALATDGAGISESFPSDFSDSLTRDATAVSGNMFSQSHDWSPVPPGGGLMRYWYSCMGSSRILSQYGRNHWQ